MDAHVKYVIGRAFIEMENCPKLKPERSGMQKKNNNFSLHINFADKKSRQEILGTNFQPQQKSSEY